MKSRVLFLLAAAFVTSLAANATATAATYTFEAFLSGPGENPPNATPGTGFGQVVLDDVLNQITVDENWSGLTDSATGSHIHTAPLNTSGTVTFSFTGVPILTAGAIPTQTFAITLAQEADLFAGNMYMDVHTSNFGAGEIRGQLVQTPEPASLTLLGAAAIALIAPRRRRRIA